MSPVTPHQHQLPSGIAFASAIAATSSAAIGIYTTGDTTSEREYTSVMLRQIGVLQSPKRNVI